MLFIIGVLIMLTAVLVLPKVHFLGGANTAKLGWMSEQWLAEQRASRPS